MKKELMEISQVIVDGTRYIGGASSQVQFMNEEAIPEKIRAATSSDLIEYETHRKHLEKKLVPYESQETVDGWRKRGVDVPGPRRMRWTDASSLVARIDQACDMIGVPAISQCSGHYQCARGVKRDLALAREHGVEFAKTVGKFVMTNASSWDWFQRILKPTLK